MENSKQWKCLVQFSKSLLKTFCDGDFVFSSVKVFYDDCFYVAGFSFSWHRLLPPMLMLRSASLTESDRVVRPGIYRW
jgi:hypothetical protein